ncbi:hypothetical protein RRG08_037977 [Elysia crispata]|uniref:Uncharacterized protein n=1 Tax=Elysia crispata TaxID=231223 RepID=A0AAE1DWK4_9GAST|nr:hypothetical protein RRG08_037977 [Elysia crispata]
MTPRPSLDLLVSLESLMVYMPVCRAVCLDDILKSTRKVSMGFCSIHSSEASFDKISFTVRHSRRLPQTDVTRQSVIKLVLDLESWLSLPGGEDLYKRSRLPHSPPLLRGLFLKPLSSSSAHIFVAFGAVGPNFDKTFCDTKASQRCLQDGSALLLERRYILPSHGALSLTLHLISGFSMIPPDTPTGHSCVAAALASGDAGLNTDLNSGSCCPASMVSGAARSELLYTSLFRGFVDRDKNTNISLWISRSQICVVITEVVRYHADLASQFSRGESESRQRQLQRSSRTN